MEKRTLGRQGLEVSAMGLGCMGMSDFYGAHDDAESIRAIYDLWSGYWQKEEDEFDFESNTLAASLAYSLHDLGVSEPGQRWLRRLQDQARGHGIFAMRARWDLGYAYIRLGQPEIGQRYYEELLAYEGETTSRSVTLSGMANVIPRS